MTPRMRQILDYVAINGEVRAAAVAENFGLAMETAGFYLRHLRHLGRVRCEGSGRHARWTTTPCDAPPMPPCSVWHLARR